MADGMRTSPFGNFSGLARCQTRAAPRPILGQLNNGPVSMKLNQPAAIDGPQQTRTAGTVERTVAAPAEQGHGVPAQCGGALGPATGGQELGGRQHRDCLDLEHEGGVGEAGLAAALRRAAPAIAIHSNRLIVGADLGMGAQHAVNRLEHVAHARLRHRAFDHHHQLRLDR